MKGKRSTVGMWVALVTFVPLQATGALPEDVMQLTAADAKPPSVDAVLNPMVVESILVISIATQDAAADSTPESICVSEALPDLVVNFQFVALVVFMISA